MVHDHLHPGIGIEKMQHDSFRQRFVARRLSDIPRKLFDYATLRLENDAVLHTATGIDTLIGDGIIRPDVTAPMVVNEQWPIYMRPVKEVASQTQKPLPVVDGYRYHPDRFNGQYQDFLQKHHKIHRVLSMRNLGSMSSVMLWMDYSAMIEMEINGSFRPYRKFDIIFRTILDTIAQIGPKKNHFIHFPQSSQLFGRQVYQRAFEGIWRNTLPDNVCEDPSMFPVLHLLAFASSIQHPVTDVKPYRPEAAFWEREKITPPTLDSVSLFSRLPDDVLRSINLIFTHNGEAVIYNMGDVKDFSSSDASFYRRLYQHITLLRSQNQMPVHVKTASDPDVLDDWIDRFEVAGEAPKEPAPEPIVGEHTDDVVKPVEPTLVERPAATPMLESTRPAPQIDNHVPESPTVPAETPSSASVITHTDTTPKAPVVTPMSAEKPVVEPTTEFEARLRRDLTSQLDEDPLIDPKRREKAQALLEAHLNTDFYGAPLGSLLTNTTTVPINKKTIPDIGFVAHPSYRESTIKNLDSDYQAKGLRQDLAKVLGVLPRHGMFIKNVQTDVVNTELDHLETHKVAMTDLDGKAHSIVLTLPVLDKNGNMRVGGITYRMTRQILGLPIYKVSATRVNLITNYNKATVERDQGVRHRYDSYITKYIYDLKSKNLLTFTSGNLDQGEAVLPYDYSAIAEKFSVIVIAKYNFNFNFFHRFVNADQQKEILPYEERFGTYIGTTDKGDWMFMDQSCQIHTVRDGKEQATYRCFTDLVTRLVGGENAPPPMVSEWTNLKLLSKSYPIIIVLAYRFGLRNALKSIGLQYQFHPRGEKFRISADDIAVKFKDGTLVFPRYPLSRSLVASGLNWCDLSKYAMSEMEAKATYSKIFESKYLSPNYLIGIDNFFEYFIDPISLEVLQEMHEPTNVRDLLLRASIMLTDYSHKEPSSVSGHRFRGNERFASLLYNEVSRQLANYKTRRRGRGGFSINPQAVFQMIAQDQTMAPVNTINPIHEMKTTTMFTFTGAQGRTSTSFVTKDRVFPKDGVGTISETSPDSGRVGITAYTSANPKIRNLRGMIDPTHPDQYHELAPNQILSVAGMTMPSATKDDKFIVPQRTKASDGFSLN